MPDHQTNNTILKELREKQLDQAGEISTLRNDMGDLKKGMVRVLYLLENDSTTDSKGMVAQLRENTIFIKDIKSKVGILSLVGGFIASIGMWIIKNLIFKQ